MIAIAWSKFLVPPLVDCSTDWDLQLRRCWPLWLLCGDVWRGQSAGQLEEGVSSYGERRSARADLAIFFPCFAAGVFIGGEEVDFFTRVEVAPPGAGEGHWAAKWPIPPQVSQWLDLKHCSLIASGLPGIVGRHTMGVAGTLRGAVGAAGALACFKERMRQIRASTSEASWIHPIRD